MASRTNSRGSDWGWREFVLVACVLGAGWTAPASAQEPTEAGPRSAAPAAETPSGTEPPAEPQLGSAPAADGAGDAAENPADDAADDAADETPRPDPLANRIEAGIEFDRLVDEERYTDAIPVGQRVIELTDAELGRDTPQSAQAHAALAHAQRLAGSYDAAERNYLESIEIYRDIGGPFSPFLIGPMSALGDTYHDAGRYLEAVSSYGEARTLSRRVYGLLNAEQIPLLDKMTESLLALNQPLEADKQQLEALRLVERSSPRESPEGLAAIYKYAGWLRETGRYQEERDQYMRALRVVREHYGDSDPRQVRALLGIGNSFRVQRIPESQGIGALREALAVLGARAEPDPLLLAEVLRDIGDWEVAFAKVEYSGAEYRRAWQLLGQLENGEELRKSWFTGPNYVLREPISQRSLSQAPEAPMGHVLVRFDIERSGQSTNVEVVESVPPGLKDEAVLRSVRRSRFRPQMTDGEIVAGKAMGLQFTFRYLPNESDSGSE